LSQNTSTALLEQVRSGRLGLAFLPLCESPRDVAITLIACEAMVLACPPHHPLAGCRDVPFAALKDELFVDFEAAWGTRRLVDQGFAQAGVERRTGFEVSDLATMLELVARGLGVALLPEAVVASRSPAVGLAELAGPELCWELVVAYAPAPELGKSPADQAPRAFLDLLTQAKGVLDHPAAA
jgi:DNA-binding transcriptional LysR family regulator